MNPAPRQDRSYYAMPKTRLAAAPVELVATYGLTRRECDVLRWVREGKRDREIAAILGLSARTVQVHVSHILEKLNVETRTAAATYSYSDAGPVSSSGARKRIPRDDAPKQPSK